ncbi:MAG: type II toxin-antitoxin system RelE/ParE family toxin [Candidatus Micrarchaeota archaeon]
MYSIVWSPKSLDQLASLEKDLAKRIVKRMEQISFTPYHFAEHLTDVQVWKIRIGDYRVILDIDEAKKEIHILKVGHRKNVYDAVK